MKTPDERNVALDQEADQRKVMPRRHNQLSASDITRGHGRSSARRRKTSSATTQEVRSVSNQQAAERDRVIEEQA